MQKKKEKQALESLKQIYLKNREEKTELAENRFLGFFNVPVKRKRKENLKYLLNKNNNTAVKKKKKKPTSKQKLEYMRNYYQTVTKNKKNGF